MANSYAGGIGGIPRERKEEEDESRHTGEARRYREETGGTRQKRGNTT